MKKKIFFITGASGVGKTTLIDHLKKKYKNERWGFFSFDSIGIPSLDEMVKNFGSPSKFQEVMTYDWIDKLIKDTNYEFIIFEGQVNLNYIHQSFNLHHFTDYKIILLDCSEEQMTYRLTHKRGQPELLTTDMKNWLIYLRKQAIELKGEVIDTSELTNDEVILTFEQKLKLSPG